MTRAERISFAALREQAASTARRLRYEELRNRYAQLYGDLQFVRTELHQLETYMLEHGEIEEGDIA